MRLVYEDLSRLRAGEAPTNLELIRDMTLGAEVWHDRFVSYYLDNYIAAGGSKVKLLTGDTGSGKSHALRYLQLAARERGYTTIHLSLAGDLGHKLSQLPQLYRSMIGFIDLDELQRGLALQVAERLGYRPPVYNGMEPLLPYVMDTEGSNRSDAMREIRIAINRSLRDADLAPSVQTFAQTLCKDRLIESDPEQMNYAARWFRGERLSMAERRESGLFDTLRRPTARRWLTSLIQLLRLAGRTGLVLLIDDLDELMERVPETNRFRYTAANIKDTYELFRQLIDDADTLPHLMVLLAGHRSLLENEQRGLRSYEALWMRLQTGLVPSVRFNGLADVVNLDLLYAELGVDFPERLAKHLENVFERHHLRLQMRDARFDARVGLAAEPLPVQSDLRGIIIGSMLAAGGERPLFAGTGAGEIYHE